MSKAKQKQGAAIRAAQGQQTPTVEDGIRQMPPEIQRDIRGASSMGAGITTYEQQMPAQEVEGGSTIRPKVPIDPSLFNPTPIDPPATPEPPAASSAASVPSSPASSEDTSPGPPPAEHAPFRQPTPPRPKNFPPEVDKAVQLCISIDYQRQVVRDILKVVGVQPADLPANFRDAMMSAVAGLPAEAAREVCGGLYRLSNGIWTHNKMADITLAAAALIAFVQAAPAYPGPNAPDNQAG